MSPRIPATMQTALPLVLLLLLAVSVAAEESRYEMTTFQFALLLPGPNERPMGEREIQAIQERHLAYLDRLYDEGRLVAAGPVDAGGKIHRVAVFAAGSTEEAEAILGEDPWILSGKMVAEVHPWWAAEGILKAPEHRLHMTTCYVGLLRRPPGAPDYSQQELQEIQAGHLANIRSMSESGDLLIAGPMRDEGALRGIFVFRTRDPAKIHELVSRDPAVRAGRLGMELYRWYVPAGTLPSP